MSLILIDTDWIIDALNRFGSALETLESLAPDGLAVSVVTFGELYQGAHYAQSPLIALAALQSILAGKDVLPVTEAIARRFAILRGGLARPLRRQIGDMDLLIAATATALTHDLTLLTRNRRDFEHVPGLSLSRSG